MKDWDMFISNIISGGNIWFGSGSGPLALNTESKPGIRFEQPLNLKPESGFRFGSAFEHLWTRKFQPYQGK
jgi:hypothetical protein